MSDEALDVVVTNNQTLLISEACWSRDEAQSTCTRQENHKGTCTLAGEEGLVGLVEDIPDMCWTCRLPIRTISSTIEDKVDEQRTHVDPMR